MKQHMGAVVVTLVAGLILVLAYHFLTVKKVDVNTGAIKTSFVGFDGEEAFEGDTK